MPRDRPPTERDTLLALRDVAMQLLRLEADPTADPTAVESARTGAARAYGLYVARFGPLNRGVLDEGRPDIRTGLSEPVWRRPELGGFRRHPDYYTVMALEVYDPDTGAAAAAPILRHRVHGPPAPVERATTVHEALLAVRTVDGSGGIDLDQVARLAGLPDAPAAAAELGDAVFPDPELGGRWVPAAQYLTGDLRARRDAALAAASDDERYRRNVDALTAAIPPDVGPMDIAVSIGAPWVEARDIEAFVHDVLGGRVRVWHLPSAASWKIVPLGRIPAGARGRFGTSRTNGYDLLTAALNGRVPVVTDTVQETGRRRRVRNVEETLAAQEKLTELQQRFRTWVWEDAERSERLCGEYNRRFNTHVAAHHDGSTLTFPGLAEGVELWPWQRDIVAQILSSRATLCAHAVGAGKTRSMICTAMTARRLGLARKPVIAVPAHLVEQTAREARQAYPAGRFLVAGEGVAGTGKGGAGGTTAGPRALLAARCATGDWDAVIMSHGTFGALPVDPGAESHYLETLRDEAERERGAGRGGRFGRSVLHRRIAVLQGRIDRLATAARPPLTFDELGLDLLLIDEAHYFKRLPVTSRMDGVSLGSSQRAADLLLKSRLLRERQGGRPSLALFTGTPWSNTIAETFVWQTFVQPEVLAAAGIAHFDAWAAVFVDYETLVEVTPDAAGIRLTQRPSRIRNLPELRRMLGPSVSVLTADDLGLERPEREERTIVCAPGEGQRKYVRTLGGRADKIRRESVKSEPGGDNMLVVCSDGRRAALDPRLVGVPEDSSKIDALADAVARIHYEHAWERFEGSEIPGVLQVIFCDQGTPGADGPQTYGRIRLALAARGVPADRVRWVHEARTGVARAALFAACRDGHVSVLLGSTDKLGVGTNVQARLRAIHHADAPWRPSDIEQREGRAFRPG